MGWMGLTERRKVNRGIRKEAVLKDRAVQSREKNRNIIIGTVVLLLVFGFLYFFVVTSTFAVKPDITKPALASASDIGADNVNWLLNEVGAYKLHPYFLFGQSPVIESVITDQSKVFTTTVSDNYPTTIAGAATNPDLRFSMNSGDFTVLYAASDTLAKAREMRKAGRITVDILKDDFTMAVKGYRAIYDALP